MNKVFRATEVSHLLLAQYVREGMTAVDATAGNGCDTKFLTGLVGPRGRVYAFDIQEQALAETKNMLYLHGLQDRVSLIKDSHDKIALYVPGPIGCLMYNLGYLPGGDKRLTTMLETTLCSLEQGMNLLAPEGIISIVTYSGHAEGARENKGVEEYLSGLPAPWQVLTWKKITGSQSAPQLFLVKR